MMIDEVDKITASFLYYTISPASFFRCGKCLVRGNDWDQEVFISALYSEDSMQFNVTVVLPWVLGKRVDQESRIFYVPVGSFITS